MICGNKVKYMQNIGNNKVRRVNRIREAIARKKSGTRKEEIRKL